jgi:hypothetical protein
VISYVEKPIIYITLFEKQLIRSYLLSDNGDFLKEISKKYKINIITSNSLQEVVQGAIQKFNLEHCVTVTIFMNYNENLLSKILNSILRFSNKSLTTILVINLQRSLGDNLVRTIIRYSIYYIFSNIKILKIFLRRAYYYSIRLKKVENCFFPGVVPDKNGVLLITSLAPLRGEDVPIGIFFKRKSTFVIGSVRSWDNLFVNGALLFLPNIFLCHSDYMHFGAVEKQGIKAKNIVMGVTPSYQQKYLEIEPIKIEGGVNFTYLCQGLTVNPDDINFVQWLISIWKLMPTNFNLHIVQHPSFIMQGLDLNLPVNIKFKVFLYEETSLYEYYSHLKNMDLVFGGGTTGILDASFLGVPTIAIGFEIVTQDYWKSTLRHFDYFPWTADFISESKITIAKSANSLVSLIRDYKNVKPLLPSTVMKYTGNPNINISQVILEVPKY